MQEAHIETTPEGQVPVDGGWFILNLGEMAWETAPGFGAWLDFFAGAHAHVLQPGESNGLYHAEAAQEGFLVLAGECIAIVESQERRMRPCDYFHSPPGTEHAAKHGASVAKTTSRDTEAYGDLPEIVRVRPPKPFGGPP